MATPRAHLVVLPRKTNRCSGSKMTTVRTNAAMVVTPRTAMERAALNSATCPSAPLPICGYYARHNCQPGRLSMTRVMDVMTLDVAYSYAGTTTLGALVFNFAGTGKRTYTGTRR